MLRPPVGASVKVAARARHPIAADLLLPEECLPEGDRRALILDVKADVAGDRHGDGLERVEPEILCLGPQAARIDGGIGAQWRGRLNEAEAGDESPFRKSASAESGELPRRPAGSGDHHDASGHKDRRADEQPDHGTLTDRTAAGTVSWWHGDSLVARGKEPGAATNDYRREADERPPTAFDARRCSEPASEPSRT